MASGRRRMKSRKERKRSWENRGESKKKGRNNTIVSECMLKPQLEFQIASAL